MKGKCFDRGIYIFKSLTIAFIFTLVLTLIITLLLTYTSLKESRMPLFNTAILIASIALGSIYMSVKVEEKGWLNGAIIGFLYYLILVLLNYLFIRSFILDICSLGKFFTALIAGVIGGIIGVNVK